MPKVTIYTTVWCGYCRRLKTAMAKHGVEFVEIDLDEQPDAGELIEGLTGGFRTVPTLEICGKYFVNPGISEVIEAVEACNSDDFDSVAS